MKCLKVAAAAVNQTPLDWESNYANIVEAIDIAAKQNVTILCLPEMALTGYGCEDQFYSNDLHERVWRYLGRICEVGNVPVVCVGVPIVYNNALYNTIAVIRHKKLECLVGKQHLAGDGIHYEPRWFKPWPKGKTGSVISPWGSSHTIGHVIGDIEGCRIGFEICEDAWVADRPGVELARQGVDIILNPSASHFAFGKHEIRKRFVIEGSRAFAATYVYANLLGNEAGRAIYDGGCLIATNGKLVAQSPRFSMKPVQVLTAVVDIQATRTRQVSTSSFSPDFKQGTKWHSVAFVPKTEELPTPPAELVEPTSAFDEFSTAVPLALYDYVRKSRSKGFVISLSGGADSAACAYLVHLMVLKGLNELGAETFCKQLGIDNFEAFDPQAPYRDAPEITERILTCVYQGTRNSSNTTLRAAMAVVEDIGAKFVNIDIDHIVNAYTKVVSEAFWWDLTWAKDDITLQNIQARTRAPSAWLIANKEGKLLITTSNRSEAAVGYCTMDGDTAGSIAPLGGIDKAFLLSWLRYIKNVLTSTWGIGDILSQKPTAELRPGESQTDEQDLMPYQILDYIEDRAILEKNSPRDVYRQVLKDFKLSKEAAYGYVKKFFELWCRNQWKRERYALSFHLDDKNLDPRSWCRFPVLSGGFRTELEELRREVFDSTT